MATAGAKPAEAVVPEWRLQPPKRSTASDRGFHPPGLFGIGLLRAAERGGGLTLAADLVFVIVVIGGTAWLSQRFAEAEEALRVLSILILAGFEIAMIRASMSPVLEPVDSGQRRARGGFFATGFAITFCDPKALAFYFGVLPAFFDLGKFGLREGSRGKPRRGVRPKP